MNAPVLTNSSGDPTDTLGPLRSGPRRPDRSPVRAADGPPESGPRRRPRAARPRPSLSVPWPPSRSVAGPLGPVAGPLGPVAGRMDAPASSPRSARPPQAPGAGGGRLEPISTPTGLAWVPIRSRLSPPPPPAAPALLRRDGNRRGPLRACRSGCGLRRLEAVGEWDHQCRRQQRHLSGLGIRNLHPAVGLGGHPVTGPSGSGSSATSGGRGGQGRSRSRRHQT